MAATFLTNYPLEFHAPWKLFNKEYWIRNLLYTTDALSRASTLPVTPTEDDVLQDNTELTVEP